MEARAESGAAGAGGVDPQQVAQLLGGLSDDQIRDLLAGETREAALEEIFRRFPEHVDTSRLDGVDAVLAWKIGGRPDGGADRYQVVIRGGEVRAGRDLGEQPQLTIVLDAVEFLKLVTGNSNPVKSFITGKLRLRGDLALAARLPRLFRIPSARGSA
jgi:putative sterol carrier protein